MNPAPSTDAGQFNVLTPRKCGRDSARMVLQLA